MGGSDTTSNSSCDVMYYLTKNPHVLQRLTEAIPDGTEVPSWEMIKNLPYLEKVLNETHLSTRLRDRVCSVKSVPTASPSMAYTFPQVPPSQFRRAPSTTTRISGTQTPCSSIQTAGTIPLSPKGNLYPIFSWPTGVHWAECGRDADENSSSPPGQAATSRPYARNYLPRGFLPQAQLSHGLHQASPVKEGCKNSNRSTVQMSEACLGKADVFIRGRCQSAQQHGHKSISTIKSASSR